MPFPIFPLPYAATTPKIKPHAGIQWPSGDYLHPRLEVRFENRRNEVRRRTSAGWVDGFSLILTVDKEDMNIVLDFLKLQGIGVDIFEITHPYLGTANVRYAGERLPIPRVVGGENMLFRLELSFEAV